MNATEWVQPAPRELLVLVRDIVEDHPERHNQGRWVGNVFEKIAVMTVDELRQYALADMPESPAMPDRPVCGTTACVAGWAVIAGSAPGSVIKRTEWEYDTEVTFPDGTGKQVSQYAQELLDLDSGQASWLFDEYRTREEVLFGLDALIGNPDYQFDDEFEEDDD